MSSLYNPRKNPTLGNLNPFRYRSYYFDTETKFYFLQSRYYDPVVGRFLNMDNPTIAFLGKYFINGLNLNSYCFNDPIGYIDDGGFFPARNKGGHGKTGIRQNIPEFYDENGRPYGYDYLQELIKQQPNTKEGRAFIQKIKTQQKYIKDGRHHGEHSFLYVNLPKWQEGFSLINEPPYQEGFSIGGFPHFQEGFSLINESPNQEGFSIGGLPHFQEGFFSPQIDTGTVLVIVGAVVVLACVAAAFFTGGQSLWGLLLV